MAQFDAGMLNRRVKVYRQSTTTDAVNAPVLSFTLLTTIWARYTPVSDSERVASSQVNAQITARFVVRYSSLTSVITPKDRLQLDGITYDISAIKEIERRRWLELTAAARTDGG